LIHFYKRLNFENNKQQSRIERRVVR